MQVTVLAFATGKHLHERVVLLPIRFKTKKKYAVRVYHVINRCHVICLLLLEKKYGFVVIDFDDLLARS